MNTRTFQTINPHNEEIIAEHEYDSNESVQEKISLSKDTSKNWKLTSIDERAELIKEIAQQLLEDKRYLAELCTQEMGKPLSQSIAEIEKSAMALNYYATHGPKWIEKQATQHPSKDAYIDFAPLGTVLAIMPWNFPFWQVLRAMGPILLTGNTMLLKHASNVTGSAKRIEEIVHKTNAPKGLFQCLFLAGRDMGQVIAHQDIHAIAFTGSTPVGQSIASTAGANLKKHVLELGGSDAYVVLADADVDLAVEKCVKSRLSNAGQSCIAAKRWIVHESLYEEFKTKAIEMMQTYTFGDPMDNPKMGPLVDVKARNHLHQQVTDAINHGASLSLGGFIPEGKGAYYPATLLENISLDNPLFEEEFFGPVAMLFSFSEQEEAFTIANTSPYGLGGAIFSKDESAAYDLALKHMDTGSIAINDMVVSHPAVPFGGIKNSGYGRELGYLALYEFSNIKTILKSLQGWEEV